MSENGPIPNDCLLYDAPWAYFMSWSDLVKVQNTDQHIIDVFNKKNVLTLENPTSVNDNSSDIKSLYKVYPNPSNEIVHIEGPHFTLLELIDMKGSILFSTSDQINAMNTQSFDNGIYILNIFSQQKIYKNKLVINR